MCDVAQTTRPECNMIKNAFTVDVEDYFQVGAFAETIDPATWDTFESRVVANTRRILELLATRQVRGTFFILGWVAERFPELVREIFRDGHEVGCHSHWHQLIYRMTPEQFRDDLVRARDVLQDIIGQPVTAFRAPSFSVVQQSLWALSILFEEGFRLDSSIFPVHHDRYGIPNASIRPFTVSTAGGLLWEFPPTVLPLRMLNFPVGGGGYLRLYPAWLTRRALRHINQCHRAFQIYVHPWEVDPDQPRLNGTFRSRFRHYVNLGTTASKLRNLLDSFEFATLSETLAAEQMKMTEVDRQPRLTAADIACPAVVRV